MRRTVQIFLLILLCLLFAGCYAGGIKYTQGEDEAGEWYITDGKYRYISFPDFWTSMISNFDTCIGSIKNSSEILYASSEDPNRILLKPKSLFDDRLGLLMREDLFPDASKEKVAYFTIGIAKPRMIDDTEAIEQLNSLLFSQEPGIQANAYELTKEEGWSQVYEIHYFYAQTDQIFLRSTVFRSPENEFYLPVSSDKCMKIEDGILKELITGIPSSKVPYGSPAMLDEKIGEAPILNSELTISEIGKLLNISEDELLALYGGQLEQVRWDNENFDYREFCDKERGLNFVLCPDTVESGYKVKYIELCGENISFHDIGEKSNFAQVRNTLGHTDVVKTEDGLPGLAAYELRYCYDDINLRVYSWDEEGDDGIYMSVVDDFIKNFRNTRITPEQIDQYFAMTKQEIEAAIGSGQETQAGEHESIEYPQYGVEFVFDKTDMKLYSLHLSSYYQISDLKVGVSIEDAMEALGKKEVKVLEENEESESRGGYLVRYDYENLILFVRISLDYSDGTYWQIWRKGYYGYPFD